MATAPAPVAGTTPHRVITPGDVRTIVRALPAGTTTTFPILVVLHGGQTVPATVEVQAAGRDPLLLFTGRRRKIALKNMITAAQKVAGVTPAPTTPAPQQTPTPGQTPPTPPPPAQGQTPPANPGPAPRARQRPNPRPAPAPAPATPTFTPTLLSTSNIGRIAGWLVAIVLLVALVIVAVGKKNTPAASQEPAQPARTTTPPQRTSDTTSADPVQAATTATADPVSAEVSTVTIDRSAYYGQWFDVAGSPNQTIMVLLPDAWQRWNNPCVKNCAGRVAYRLLGARAFTQYYPAEEDPDFGNTLQRRGRGQNTTWQMRFICPDGKCPVLRFVESQSE